MTFHRNQKLITGFLIMNFAIILFILGCFKKHIPTEPYLICAGIISFVIPFFISEDFYDYVEDNSLLWNSLYILNIIILLIVMIIYKTISK